MIKLSKQEHELYSGYTLEELIEKIVDLSNENDNLKDEVEDLKQQVENLEVSD